MFAVLFPSSFASFHQTPFLLYILISGRAPPVLPKKYQINIHKKSLATLPVNDFSSWHLAKSQTLTVLSSEQEQNFKSVLEKLFEEHVSAQ
jgi:hypothetical protein